ncbi:hypothetical protein [Mobilicoccus sp.]|uniref:hypothetical protein n=1 Tax=Mobilicoccus sp. TaxID=2034349 RepID=UPI00289E6A5D|nr:hypothetical protein [Mobilicoccus sp.]
MNTTDLFDRMAGELAASGAVEEARDGRRTLTLDGAPFARLVDDGAEVYLPDGSAARADALALPAVSEAGGGWLTVTDGDVAAWPVLFEQALAGLRR